MSEKINWKLKDVLKDEKEFYSLIKSLEKDLAKYDLYFKKLSPSMSIKAFKELMSFTEQVSIKTRRLGAYVSLISSTDTKSQKVMRFQPLLENLSIKLSDKARPINFWLKGLEIKGKKRLDDKNAERLFSFSKSYYYPLMYSRKLAKHNLSQDIEMIINRKDINGVGTITELYDKITTNFQYKFKVGKTEKVFHTQEELKKYYYHSNPKYRKAAYDAQFRTFEDNKETLFTIYAAVVKDWNQEKDLRKYKSAITVRNLSNGFDDEVIQTVLDVVKKNRKIYQDYFKVKAKLLGLKKLARTDIYASIKSSQDNISFKESKKQVMQMFQEFHPEFAKKANILFQRGHIDSHPKKDKRAGAFCMSVTSDIAPYVLLNHTDSRRDVSTMAHELGHAIHDLYTSDLPLMVSHAPLPLCETASTFAELLLFEKELKASNKKQKIELLVEKISDSYATIMRQSYFVRFEIMAHEKIPLGATEEELSDMYFETLKEQFGNSLTLPRNFRYEWSVIPHIVHTPFYCYAYTFGDLLSLALYAQYKKQGKSFIPKLERILSAGGSQDPTKLLKKEGFDITKDQFWQSGLDVVNSWLKELKKLT